MEVANDRERHECLVVEGATHPMGLTGDARDIMTGEDLIEPPVRDVERNCSEGNVVAGHANNLMLRR